MFLLVSMLLVVIAALAVVGHLSIPETERRTTQTWSPAYVLASAHRGNSLLARGPRYQYDQIARSAR